MRARHSDHVELAALNRMPRGRDVLDAGGVKGRQAGFGAHLAGEIKMRRRALAHAGDHAAEPLFGVDMATDHVEKVDQSRAGQPARDRHALLAVQAPLPVLVADQPRSKKEIAADASAHRLEHGHTEPQAIVDRPAIFVPPLVGRRRPELIDEMAVAFEFEPIQPAGFHPFGRVCISRDHAGKVPVLHRLREGAVGRLADRRRRDDRQPVVLAPAGATAEMGDLDHHRRTLVVDVVRQLLEPAHAFVFVEKDVAEGLRAVRRHHRGAADHGERNASLGLFGVVEAIALFGHAVLGIGRLVRGRHQPVAQRQAAQLKGLQQWIAGHAAASKTSRLSGAAGVRSMRGEV